MNHGKRDMKDQCTHPGPLRVQLWGETEWCGLCGALYAERVTNQGTKRERRIRFWRSPKIRAHVKRGGPKEA